MFRKTALVMALTGALTAGNAVALGLGDIDLKSSLNQPFNAEVELLSATEDELHELKVALGSRQAFDSAGIDRSAFLTKLKFTVTQNNTRTPVIRITSREPVTEPFLDFLLEIAWSKGKLLREFTVLVDPPVTMPAAPVTLQAPAVRPVTPVVQTPSQPVAPPQNVAAAPDRRVQNTALPPLSKAQGEYGPTQRNDTLWTIAERVRPDTDVSMHQTMMGLLRANPEAFVNNNINNLKTGYVLRVPDRDELTSISSAEARQQASEQYNAWRQARTGGISTPQQSVDSSESGVDAAPAATAGESKLQLVAPELDQAGAGTVDQAAEQDSELNTLKRDLVLANEALEAQRSESQEMAGRLSVLEEQIQNMQRLIQLKDDELARLQAQTGSDAALAASTDAVAETAEDVQPVIDPSVETAEDAQPVIDPSFETAMEAEAALSETIEDVEQAAEVTATPETDVETQSQVAETDVPVTTESDSFSPSRIIEQLLQNPIWLGVGGAILALLAFFGLRGRSGTESEFQESILRGSGDEVTDFSETQSRDSSLNDSSLLSEFAVSDMVADDEHGETNPMGEAEVYLAYGRFQQAEELLKEALADAPDNEELNFKLLEVYQAAGNMDGFDNHASDMLANLGDRGHPMWQKVEAMGLALNPANPLYHPDGVMSSSNDATSADVADEMHDDMEAPVDMGMNQEPVAFDQTPSIDTLQNDVQETVTDNTLDFDLENFDIGAGSESSDADMPSDGQLADLDEISTKLDLARAYIDMGDPEGARNILDEVIEEGNDDQKNEAQGILERLAS